MYKGKFDSKNRNSTVSVQDVVSQRNAAPTKEAPVKKEVPVKKETPVKETAAKAAPVKKEAPAKAAPAKTPAKAAPTKEPAPAKKEAPAKETPAKKTAKKQKKGPRLGGVIFYTVYFMFILVFFLATYVGLQWLHGWLIDYEAAQPTTKCVEVFEQLFSDPDWSALYDAAGVEDTPYEGKEEFVAYMENKVGDNALTFLETSTGLSTDKKYVVKLDNEKIATFTLVGQTEHKTDIPDWQLGTIELFYEREESFLIQKLNKHTAYVNGVALDENFTIQKASTKADTTEGFLPAGASSATIYTQQITGLMTVPTVTILDENGQEMGVVYDEATKTFVEQTEVTAISDAEKEVALNAIKIYAQYQIKEATRAEVSKYFDPSGDAYTGIMKTVLDWTKGNNGYSFANDTVSSYARYSDTLFSVYATTEMTINLTDGGTQVKPINATLLFEQKNGSWKVIRMTNADVSTPVGQVRLTFMQDSTLLASDFYRTDASEIITPIIPIPEGKVFTGWVTVGKDEDGSIVYNLVFQPDETGKVVIPDGTSLEPMTLYALFEDAGAAAAAAETAPAETAATPETTEGA